MFYILHGEETFTRSESVKELRGQVAQDGMGDLNITVLDGRSLTLGELMNACNTPPFLTQRRLIIVENMLQRYQRGGAARGGKQNAPDSDEGAKLLDYLPTMPDTTRLVFVEDGLLGKSNVVLKGAAKIEGGYVKDYSPLESGKLQNWVITRCKDKGATISRSAVIKLISYVGNDLRLIDQELCKLAAFVDYDAQQTISDETVDQLVAASQDSNIFGLVDALGMRQREQALRQLGRLQADGANELYLLSMFARQVRLLISAKDLAEEQHLPPEEILRRLHMSHRFILDKLLTQSARFATRELHRLLERILEVDQDIKTGRMDGALAIEMLIIQACAPSRPQPSQAQ